MPFTQEFMPQYRDADADGLIRLKGCLRTFQDIHTWYMHSIDKGNDVIPERYGCAWVYTRYRMKLHHPIDYTDRMEARTWIEPYRVPFLIMLDLEIRQHGRIAAEGRLENCIYSLEKKRLMKLDAVEFPEGMAEEIPGTTIPELTRADRDTDGLEERYIHTVRVSDLDKSGHMNNLRYIEMFQDAFSASFWKDFDARETEIHFLSQCMEGERISVRAAVSGNTIRMAALHADGSPASVAAFFSGV